MADQNDYVPPKVWSWDKESGGRFANINRPIAGPTHDKDLPVGKHPLQLYSLGTPNGVKVTVMLEELLAAGHSGAEYDAWLINIGEGDQFSSGFVDATPGSACRRCDRRAPGSCCSDWRRRNRSKTGRQWGEGDRHAGGIARGGSFGRRI